VGLPFAATRIAGGGAWGRIHPDTVAFIQIGNLNSDAQHPKRRNGNTRAFLCSDGTSAARGWPRLGFELRLRRGGTAVGLHCGIDMPPAAVYDVLFRLQVEVWCAAFIVFPTIWKSIA